jgi:hypothetical protein
MRVSLLFLLAAVAAVDCRPAEPARLRMEHVTMQCNKQGVLIAFDLVNEGGRDAYAFTTSHGTEYNDNTGALTVYVRQRPFAPTGTTGDMHFFLQPFERIRARERRLVQIALPPFIDGVDLRVSTWFHEPIYRARSLHLEVGWSERPFDEAFRDPMLADAHQEMADRVFALQTGVLVADTR